MAETKINIQNNSTGSVVENCNTKFMSTKVIGKNSKLQHWGITEQWF